MKAALVLGMVLVLAVGCGGRSLRQVLGFEGTPPDEFLVAPRAPLEAPEGLFLRAPVAGTPRPQEQAPQKLARRVLAEEETEADEVSEGMRMLLMRAGITDVEEERVRERLWQGAGEQSASQQVLEAGEEAETVGKEAWVDAIRERQRLKLEGVGNESAIFLRREKSAEALRENLRGGLNK